jgi:uncharacterized membrane protein YhhN
MYPFGNKQYKFVKYLSTTVLPAAATAVGALGIVWGWASADQIVLTVTIINTLLGAMANISTAAYDKSKASDTKKAKG